MADDFTLLDGRVARRGQWIVIDKDGRVTIEGPAPP